MRDKRLKYGSNEVHRRKSTFWDKVVKAEFIMVFILVTIVLIGVIAQLV